MSQAAPLPARMLNEWVYCPRLAVLEHVHREWADSADTVDGKRVHRRVDEPTGAWPEAEALQGEEVARSLWLSAQDEGITARLDLVESTGDGRVRPIDFKRGQAPDLPEGAWLPERVQVCAQALVLRENGYRCDEGAIWFAASRRRVMVAIDEELVAITRRAARELRAAADREELPAPLVDSPKCTGCSLAPICLPDEVGLLDGRVGDLDAAPEDRLPRRLVPARDDGVALHVLTQGARLGVSGEELVVRKGREVIGRCSLPRCAGVALHGNIQVSTQAMGRLLRAGVPVAWFTMGGWFKGIANGMPHGNIALRQAQHRVAGDAGPALALARGFVVSKLRNQRTLLRRNARARAGSPSGEDGSPGDASPEEATRSDVDKALRALAQAAAQAGSAADVGVLLGCEGSGARAYFGAFTAMLTDEVRALGLDVAGRNRRPPTDPVNAALSFAYALLSRELTHICLRVGLEPMLGFLHKPRHGRPALALDLMEEFRPVLSDSAVITAFNNGELRPDDFVRRGPACNLSDRGRRKLIAAWERRVDLLVTHPVFGYRISYRRVLEVQTRLLARFLLGELDHMPSFEIR